MKYLFLFTTILTFSISSFCASLWQMEIPLIYDGTEVKEVIVESDGINIINIDSHSLLNALKKYINKDIIDKITTNNPINLSIEDAKRYGIYLDYKPKQVELSVNFDSDILVQKDIFLSDGYALPNYANSANYTLQNTFNANIDHSTYAGETNYNLEALGAMNIGGVYGGNLVWSGNFDYSQQSGYSSQRGPIQAFFERPDIPLIVSIGNINTPSSSYTSSVEVSGVGISRSRSQLRPTEKTNATPNDEFLLLESAQVTILLNGYFYQRISLPAGRYTLKDLPISSGANDITLQVNYTSGRYEEFQISNFYDANLLSQGYDDFNFAIGYPVDYSDTFIGEHESNILLSSNYSYGVTDNVTLGAAFFYHPDGIVAGSSGVFGSNVGNFSITANYSYTQLSEQYEQAGTAFSFNYSYAFLTTQRNLSTSIRMNTETFNEYRTDPWVANSSSQNYDTYRLSLNQDITGNTNLDITGSYINFSDEDSESNFGAAINYYINNFNFRFGYEFEKEKNKTDNTLYFELRYNASTPIKNVRFSADYKSRDNQARLELSKGQGSTIGSLGGYLTYEYNDDYQQMDLEADYLSNRAKLRGNISSTVSNEGNNDTNITGSMSSTFALVGGYYSISSQPIGAIALFHPYNDLGSDVIVNPTFNNEYDVRSNSIIDNHYTLIPHLNNTVFYDTPNAPIGYSIGDGLINIAPGTYTGHVITVGSKYSKTVIGTLVDNTGQAIALVSGFAKNDEHAVSFFTNNAGRFVLEGVRDGEYTLKVNHKLSNAVITIPKNNNSIVKITEVVAHE